MASLRRDVRRLLNTLEQSHGCTVTETGAKHWRVTRPGAARPITVSRTPSDQRAMRNIRSEIRRYLGIQL